MTVVQPHCQGGLGSRFACIAAVLRSRPPVAFRLRRLPCTA